MEMVYRGAWDGEMIRSIKGKIVIKMVRRSYWQWEVMGMVR